MFVVLLTNVGALLHTVLSIIFGCPMPLLCWMVKHFVFLGVCVLLICAAKIRTLNYYWNI